MEKNDLDYLVNQVKIFCAERDWDQYHNPKDLAIGISTEANELLDCFRFKSEEQSKALFNDEIKREKIEDEFADTLFFLLRFAYMNDIDIAKALERKIEKNAIKYPIDKTKGNNQKYTEYE
jgi:NTP pyrophosphatase (non-canonical NTP hydrolase)